MHLGRAWQGVNNNVIFIAIAGTFVSFLDTESNKFIAGKFVSWSIQSLMQFIVWTFLSWSVKSLHFLAQIIDWNICGLAYTTAYNLYLGLEQL